MQQNPLYLDAMQVLGMDVRGLEYAMGTAYAIVHWGAEVNGDDVESALGTSVIADARPSPGLDAPPSRCAVSPRHRPMRYGWLQCSPDVVYQAFKGAMVTGDHQNFIPNSQKSPAVFADFKDAYLQASKMTVAEKWLGDKFSVDDFMRESEEYAEDFH